MKKVLIFLIVLVMCFGGCSAAEATDEYSFSISDYYSKDGTVFCSYPEIFENKIVFCAASHISNFQSESGNVVIYDLLSNEESSLDISAISAFISNDKIYYASGKSICKASLDGKDIETVFTAPDDKLFGFSKGGSNGCFIFWISDSDYSNAELFCYNTDKDSYSSVATPSGILNAFQPFKIKNGFVCYAEKVESYKYNIYGVNLSTGKSFLLWETEKEPSQYVYNGSTLVWSDSNGIHYLDDGEVFTLDGKNGDVDIFKNRYIFCFNNFQIYIYDVDTEQIVFTTSSEAIQEDEAHPEYCQWFSLDEENGKAVFILWDKETALANYPDWSYEEYPELISVMDIKKSK